MRTAFVLLVSAIFLQACQSGQKKLEPQGEWVWSHPSLNGELEDGMVTAQEVEHKFYIDQRTCKIDSLKVPVPSPSCYVVPPPDCRSEDGVARAFCRARWAKEKCDYSSVEMAKSAQSEVFDACMELQGWEKIWQAKEPEVSAETAASN